MLTSVEVVGRAAGKRSPVPAPARPPSPSLLTLVSVKGHRARSAEVLLVGLADRVVGHRVTLQVLLDGRREREPVDVVDGSGVDYRHGAELVQGRYWKKNEKSSSNNPQNILCNLLGIVLKNSWSFPIGRERGVEQNRKVVVSKFDRRWRCCLPYLVLFFFQKHGF